MAEPLSLGKVLELAQLLGGLPDEQGQQLGARFRREQPILHKYLLASDHPPFTLPECEMIYSVGLTVWLIMERGGRPAAEVTSEILCSAADALDASMGRLAGMDQEARQGPIAAQVMSHPEPGLLGYLSLMVKERPDSPFNSVTRALALRILMILLDALIASRGRRGRPRRLRSAPAGRA
jgi:hypothetical protein